MSNGFVVPVSDDERVATIKAIDELNAIEHVKYMSLSMLADTAGIRQTKMRHVLDDLMQSGSITRYIASENIKLPRYYYVVEAAGRELVAQISEANQHG